MKVLVIGSGGREHALVWKISQSPRVNKIYCAPGNAGTSEYAENVPIKADDLKGLKKFALSKKIDLTVVGPEVPLVAGLVNEFEKEGLKVFGPCQEAAIIEGSKVWSKQFMVKYDIPTAKAGIFNDLNEAKKYLDDVGAPIVVKADGLAAVKGVIVCQTKALALEALKLVMEKKEFGKAGDKVVIEEYLVGEEASIIAITDGKTVVPLASSQDHKRVFDNDEGPNTGGMGAYSPAPVVTDRLMEEIDVNVLRPFISGMRQEGIEYKGVIYAGVMITKDGPKVLEFNCRFGDPETQPIMMRLKSDLVEHCLQAIDGKLDSATTDWDERTSIGVVLAAGGYPDNYNKGDVISGLDSADNVSTKIFHAGTAEKDGQVVTNGGRVLCVCALGDSVTDAQAKAYEIVNKVSWKDVYFRTDIGHRAIAREKS
ncbi:MAG: phosphoribosylamine--glycine ligase [Gammaproteobacteria bacterium]|nr:phosphoribosylamine--glycine ligase [Gammaproteobacteria bacterium]